MFKFLKMLFGGPKFGIGVLPSPADSRNIDIARVQQPVSIPDFYLTDLSPFGVNDQGVKSTCVGETMSKVAEYYFFKRTGELRKFDAQKLYDQCKREDGIPDLDGTYATIAAKIVIRDGIDQYGKDSNDQIATAYVFVPTEFEAIAQALYQNGVLPIGLFIGSDWFYGIIGKALKYIGGHETLLHGYDKDHKKLYGLNSWGIQWIGQIAGWIDIKVKEGHYVANFDDIKTDVMNILAFVPVPKKVVEEVKSFDFKFLTDLRKGMTSYDVKKLQERLKVEPQSGFFGSLTEKKVIEFQILNNLTPDGKVGPMTRQKLNGNTKSFIPQLAEAIKQHEGYFAGSRSFRNHSPGNFKLASNTLTSYMIKLGATSLDVGNFVIFPNYETGFKALCQFLTDACLGKLSSYKPEMTINQFFHKYAPMSENDTQKYVNSVCKKLGVEQTLQIKELI